MSEQVEGNVMSPAGDVMNMRAIEEMVSNTPFIQIHIRGSIHSGKSRLAARIARLIEEEVGYPYTFISGDGDFAFNYQRCNEKAPKLTGELNDIPLDVVVNRGSLDLKPVAITIIDDNAAPKLDDTLPRHCHTFFVNP